MIEKSQYRFLQGKSYEMPLLAIRIAISIALEKGLDLLLASFDAEKFYPSCSPYIIMRENFIYETVGPAEADLQGQDQYIEGRGIFVWYNNRRPEAKIAECEELLSVTHSTEHSS